MAYIGNEPFFGFIKSEELTSEGGSQYTLGRVAPSKDSIQVSVNGIIKRPSEYGLSGRILTLAGVPTNDIIFVRYLTTTGTISTYTQASSLPDNIVTNGKILDGAVTDDKIVSVAASKLTGSFGGTFQQDIFTGDGTTLIYTLSQDVAVPASIIVTVSGIHQFSPNHYTLSGTGNRTMTFNTAPATTLLITVQYLGIVTDVGVPSGGTLTESMFFPGLIPVRYNTNPTVTSAETYTYPIGTLWINNTDGNIFVLIDDTVGANIWRAMAGSSNPLQNLVGGQQGAVITYDGNGNWVVKAPGDAGQVLMSSGFAKDVEWVGGWGSATNGMDAEAGKSYLVDTSVAGGTITKIVKVLNGKFTVDGVSQPVITMLEGLTYKFDTSHFSNAGHHFKFSITADGTYGSGVEYTTGVTYNGTPGSTGAYTQIVVAAGEYAAPELYYWCHYHASMGAIAHTHTSPTNGTNVAWSIFLPLVPIAGQVIRFLDLSGNFSTNNLEILRNGKYIQGLAQDIVITGGPSVELVYASATHGWRIVDTSSTIPSYISLTDTVTPITYAASVIDTDLSDRTSDITVTTNLTLGSGTIDNLVDGGYVGNAAESITVSTETVDATKYIQFAFETPNIMTEVRMWNHHDNTLPEVPLLTVTSTAEAFTVGETITGSSSGATGTVILGDANTTTVTYTETSGTTRFTTSDTITGGTSTFTKTVTANDTPYGIWQWQGSETGVWGGEEVNIGAEWAWHNEGTTYGASPYSNPQGYLDRTELSANTTGYKYYRMKGVRGATWPRSDWFGFYFTRQISTVGNPAVTIRYNTSYYVDTTSGAFTVHLPVSPNINDYVEFTDQASKFATNKLTVGRNGKNIQSLGEDLDLDISNSSTRLSYTGPTNGWVLS